MQLAVSFFQICGPSPLRRATCRWVCWCHLSAQTYRFCTKTFLSVTPRIKHSMLSLSGYRSVAAWRGTCWEKESWETQHPQCHPFFKIPSTCFGMIYPDQMHTKHLGTDQVLIASCITWLVKHFLKASVKDNLEYLWASPKEWHKDIHGF